MDYKKRMRMANRRMRRKMEEDRDQKAFHSRSYHRYFEGYKEYETADAKGKKRLKRVYVGNWYRQELKAPAYIGLRILYVLLTAGVLAFFVAAALSQKESGSAIYVVLPEAVTVGFLVYLLYTLLVNYLFIPRNMTVNDYRISSKALKKGSLCCTACLAADALATLLYLLLHGDASAGIGGAALEFFAAAALSAAVSLAERKIPYSERENEVRPDEGDVVIQSDENFE